MFGILSTQTIPLSDKAVIIIIIITIIIIII